MVEVAGIELNLEAQDVIREVDQLEKQLASFGVELQKISKQADGDLSKVQPRLIQIAQGANKAAARLQQIAPRANDAATALKEAGVIGTKAFNAMTSGAEKANKAAKNLLFRKADFKTFGAVLQKLGEVAQRTLFILISYNSFRFALRQVRNIAEFERSLATLGAVAQATGSDLEKMKQQALELAKTTKFIASEVITAQEGLARAGFDVNEVLAATPGVLQLATAAAVESADAQRILVSTLRQFNISATETNRVADILTATTLNSATSLTELGEGLKIAGPQAAAVGLTLEDTAAALGVLADSGLKATVGGTQFRKVIAALSTQTPKATAAFKELGINLSTLELSGGGLLKLFQDLSAAGIGTEKSLASNALAVEAFTIRGATAITALAAASDETEGRFQRLSEAILNAKGVTEETARSIQDNLAGELDRLRATFDAFIQTIGEAGGSSGASIAVKALTAALEDLAVTIPEVSTAAASGRGIIREWAEDLLAAVFGIEEASNAAGEGASNFDKFSKQLIELRDEFDPLDEQIEAVTLGIDDTGIAFERASGHISDFRRRIVTSSNALENFSQESLDRLGDASDKTAGDLLKLTQKFIPFIELVRTQGVKLTDEQAAGLERLGGFVAEASKNFEEAPAFVTEFLDALKRLNVPLNETERAAKEATDNLRSFEEAVDLAGDGVKKFADLATDGFEDLSDKAADLQVAFQLVAEQFGEASPEAQILREEAFKLVKNFKDLEQTVPAALQAIADGSKSAKDELEKLGKQSEKTSDKQIKAAQRAEAAFAKFTDTIRKQREELRAIDQEIAELDAGGGKASKDREKSLAKLNKEQEELLEKGSLTVEEQNRLNELQDEIFDKSKKQNDLATEIADNQERQALLAERQNVLAGQATDLIERAKQAQAKLTDEGGEYARTLDLVVGNLDIAAKTGALSAEQIATAQRAISEAFERQQDAQEKSTQAAEAQAKATKDTAKDTELVAKRLEDGSVVLEQVEKSSKEAAKAAGEHADATKELDETLKDVADAAHEAFVEGLDGLAAFNVELTMTRDLAVEIKKCLQEING
jgi:TP901 family phage tail tape measure protein